MKIFASVAAAVILLLLAWAWFSYAVRQMRYHIENEVFGMSFGPEAMKSYQKEWYELSWSGKNPMRVIALIYSKMYALTDDMQHKEKALAFVKRDHDPNHLDRIVGHLKLSGVYELYRLACV